MPSPQEIKELLRAAIEASVYVEPSDPGLTIPELYEIGKQLGLKDGELGDVLPSVVTARFGAPNFRQLLSEPDWHMSGYLTFSEDPDLRNVEAFDFVMGQLIDIERELGFAHARIDRAVILDRATARALPRHDIEVAVSLMLLSGQLSEDNGLLRFRRQAPRQLPSESRNQPGAGTIRHLKTARTRVMPHVKDVVGRRSDGRPKSAEPFGAFAEQLDTLGYGRFRLWWTQAVTELGRTDPGSSPLSALVLAAAIVEGALTFVVKHAQQLEVGAFGSTDFKRDPKTWKIDDLINGAARGGDDAVLDHQSKMRAEALVNTRQRIHAGRMLSEFPNGVPDLRPEEAREAKATAELVVRRVLDWLERHPRTLGAASGST